MDAGQDLDERRLTGTVLADEAVHLAAEQLDITVLERVDRAEALLGVLEGKYGSGMRCRHDRRVEGRRSARRPSSSSS